MMRLHRTSVRTRVCLLTTSDVVDERLTLVVGMVVCWLATATASDAGTSLCLFAVW